MLLGSLDGKADTDGRIDGVMEGNAVGCFDGVKLGAMLGGIDGIKLVLGL